MVGLREMKRNWGCFATAYAVLMFCFVFFFATDYYAKEGENAIDLNGKDTGYTSVLYDNSNGLPTSEANDIIQTSDGFIWIGSYSGLIRYDGNEFERFDSTTGVTSVVSLFEDSKERLWIGTNDSGVAVMEEDTIRFFNKNDGLQSLAVRDIREDENGIIYVATTNGIAIIDEDMNLIPIDEGELAGAYIKNLSGDENGMIYGVTIDDDLFIIKNRELVAFYKEEEIGIEEIHTIVADPENDGWFYVGTKNNEVYYTKVGDDSKEREVYNVAPLEYINHLYSVDDRIFICADNGIGYLENEELYIVENIALTNSVERMMVDYQGNLWFASSKQGVMKITPCMFYDVFLGNDIENCVVNTTCIKDDELYIGTKASGLIVVSQNGVKKNIPLTEARTVGGVDIEWTDLLAAYEGGNIRSIVCDSRGRLWISSYGDYPLVRYENGKVTCFTKADGLPSDRVRTVFERDDDTFLVACTGGVAVIKGDSVTDVYNEDDGIENTEVLTVTAKESENGDIIVGTDGGGIYVIGSNGTTHIGVEEGMSSEIVMRVKVDEERGLVWLVTSNSIAYLDNDYNINVIKKFPYSNNFDMYENANGTMWILSSNGIYTVSVDELIANGEISPEFYSADNGLNCIATANSYSALSDDGDLYVAGTTGVSKVNINKPFTNNTDLKASVPYIEVDGEYVYPDENGEYTLSEDAQKVTISTFVFNYSLINPLVTYYLSGFENNKVTVDRTDLMPVDYTNLRGGEYDFVVKLQDPSGSNEDKSITVHITKEKQFYEHPWFFIIAALIAGILIQVAVHFYIKHKTAVYEKKARENQILVHEITEAFAKVIDMKDKYTNGHSTRVGEYTVLLAKELGYDDDTVDKYYNIALLHDIGKIGVPSAVLNKQGKLSEEEFAIIKSHPVLGYNALKDISIMPELAVGAGSHHERPDGKGYPNGLKGDEIPRVAQIIAVADTFDAMYSKRPYRSRMNFEKAVSIIKDVRGTQLTADVVDAFLRLVEKGEFRAPDDDGGGSTEDINNL